MCRAQQSRKGTASVLSIDRFTEHLPVVRPHHGVGGEGKKSLFGQRGKARHRGRALLLRQIHRDSDGVSLCAVLFDVGGFHTYREAHLLQKLPTSRRTASEQKIRHKAQRRGHQGRERPRPYVEVGPCRHSTFSSVVSSAAGAKLPN